MSAVDYLLHESSVGYAIFQVIHQADAIGNRLKEVQDASQDLAKFGKTVKLVNFAPYRYTISGSGGLTQLTFIQRSC
jgi:nucleolar protein 56